MTMKPRYPGWRYGPNGEAEIFQCAEDVPEGWYDTPQEAAARAEERVSLRFNPEATDDYVVVASAQVEAVPKKRGRPKK